MGRHGPRRVRHLGAARSRVHHRAARARPAARHGRPAQRHDRQRRPVPPAGAPDRQRCRVRRGGGAAGGLADPRARLDRGGRACRDRRRVRGPDPARRQRVGDRPAAARLQLALPRPARAAPPLVAHRAAVPRRSRLGDRADHAELAAVAARRRAAGRRRRLPRHRRRPAGDRDPVHRGRASRGHRRAQRGLRRAAHPPFCRRRAEQAGHAPDGHPQRQPPDGRGGDRAAHRGRAAAPVGHRHRRPARRHRRARGKRRGGAALDTAAVVGAPGRARAARLDGRPDPHDLGELGAARSPRRPPAGGRGPGSARSISPTSSSAAVSRGYSPSG